MDFLKRHVFLIACGAAALAGIALGLTGLQAMPAVVQEMEQAKKLYDDLERLERNPANDGAIRALQARIDLVLEDSAAVRSKIAALYHYEPLVKDVLPEGANTARFEFAAEYERKMQELFDSVKPGRPPSAAQVDAKREQIELEHFRREERGLDPGVAQSAQPVAGPAFSPAGVLTLDGAMEDAEARASMQEAKAMYCYATLPDPTLRRGTTPSLSYFMPWKDVPGEPPLLENVWWAQLGYWIQKDVIDAIVGLNEAAAATAREKDEDRWVGMMPVKEIISIRLSSGFIVEDDDAYVGPAAGGYAEAFPCATPNTVFSGSTSRDAFDVVQFTVKLIMDQRDIPALIDRMSKNKMHILQRVAYRSVPPNREMRGRIYGPEPAVNVVLDFETLLLADVFRPLMPQEICDRYDHLTCDHLEKTEE